MSIPPAQPMGPIGKPRSIGLTILVTIVTFGIWTWFWSYWNGEELKRYRNQGLGGIFYLLMAIFLNPVVMFLLADEVGKMYEEAGEPAPINALWGLWFLLPLIGNIVWYVKIQGEINRFWIARGAPPATGV